MEAPLARPARHTTGFLPSVTPQTWSGTTFIPGCWSAIREMGEVTSRKRGSFNAWLKSFGSEFNLVARMANPNTFSKQKLRSLY